MSVNNLKYETNFKKWFRKLLNRRSVISNQRQILKMARENSNEFILLKPTPVIRCGGTVDHYYHFIFDLVLPLYCLFKKTSTGNKVKVKVGGVGLFSNLLLQIFPKGVELIKSDSNSHYEELTETPLMGMNPKCVFIEKKMIEEFKQNICNRFEVKSSEIANKILLIERLPPDEYFMSKSEVVGGGASWRSIVNHSELLSTVSSMVREPYEFHNLCLEEILFEEQVYLFDNASLVIAQHGAGLSNCTWMRSKATVIELGYDEKDDHFRTISQLRHLNYFWYRTDSNHATIDLKDFLNWLSSKPGLGRYLKF